MMVFSTLNLLLDVVNVICFAWAEEKQGMNKVEQQYNILCSEGLPGDNNGYEFNEGLQHEENDEDNCVNLNMRSTYTHVFADTIQSIAVIAASIISETVDSGTSEVVDSSAGVIVFIIDYDKSCSSFLSQERGVSFDHCM